MGPCPSANSLEQPAVNSFPSSLRRAVMLEPHSAPTILQQLNSICTYMLHRIEANLSPRRLSTSVGLATLFSSPCPRTPCLPLPQENTMPDSVTTNVKLCPQATISALSIPSSRGTSMLTGVRMSSMEALALPAPASLLTIGYPSACVDPQQYT